MNRLALVALLATAACRKVEPVPEDVDGLLRLFWVGFDPATGDDDARLGDALQALHDAVDVAPLLDAHIEGELPPLTDAEVAGLPITPPPDPSTTTGLLLQNRYPCTRGLLEQVLVFEDQNAIYETYDAYERRFETDIDAFLAEDEAFASWTGTIEATIPTLPAYVYDFRTSLRRVPLPDTHPSAPGFAVVARTYMLSPAVFDREDAKAAFPQDYQLEIYVPYDGDIVHHYGFWREMSLGVLGTMEDRPVVAITLNESLKWDDRTAEVCAAGGPDAFVSP